MKTRYSYIILLIALSLAACSKDFLEQSDPNNPTEQQFWRNASDAQAAIIATYQPLTFSSRWNFFECGWGPENWRADDVFYGGEYPSFSQIANFINTPELWEVEILFQNGYQFVNRANQSIEGIPLCDMDASLQQELISEARFLRAYGYFKLLRNFRHIPFHPRAPQGDDIYAAQVDRSVVWELIEQDLQDAVQKLPLTRSGDKLGRATKATAAAFLGYAYLYQQKYSQAKEVLMRIYNGELGTYNLLPIEAYSQNFDGYNEFNEESLWEIPFSRTSNWSTVNVFSAEFLSWEEANASAWIFNHFMNEPDAEGNIDPRYFSTLISPQADFETPYGYYADITSSGRNIILKHTTHPWAANNAFENNYPLMRYADVLLMLAEAVNEADGPEGALLYINQVRQRANKAPVSSGISREALRREIMDERALELSFESRRWYDLVRWHEAGFIDIRQVLLENGAQGAGNFTEQRMYFPIPEAEYNTNPKLDRSLQW